MIHNTKLHQIKEALRKDDKNLFSASFRLTSSIINSIIRFFSNWNQNYDKVILIVIIALALFVRIGYVDYALPYIYHHDEPYTVSRTIQMLQDGDLNPHFFYYPTLTTYIFVPFFVLDYYRLLGQGELSSLNDIMIDRDTGWKWTISHPSFYAVGRLVIVLLALLSIYFVYEVGKRYFNKKTGLLAALILSFFPLHLEWSTKISPNMTVVVFVLLSLIFVSQYIEKKRLALIALAGISCGLSIASKYNSFFIILPAIFAILFYGKQKIRDLAAVTAAAPFGFFLGCPFALFDLSTFLSHSGAEVVHYSGSQSSEISQAGGGEFSAFFSDFKEWIRSLLRTGIGWAFSLLGALAYFIFDIRKFLIVFSFPIFYTLYMSRQLIYFDRNMLCVIPFVALSLAVVLNSIFKWILNLVLYLRKRKILRFQLNEILLFSAFLIVLLLIFGSIKQIRLSIYTMTEFKEPRTEAVEYIRDNYPEAKVAISKELMIHEKDLRKMKNFHIIATRTVALSDLHDENYDLVLSSDKYKYRSREQEKMHANKLRILENKFPAKSIIKTFGNKPVVLDNVIRMPKIHIYTVDENFLRK
jgi:4-amino-4-deoxy-L-arabinose transferase-like glycosyltransferase